MSNLNSQAKLLRTLTKNKIRTQTEFTPLNILMRSAQL